ITVFARGGLALQAVMQDDVVSAGNQYTALESQAGPMSAPVMTDGRLLGLLSKIIGNMGQATVHFESSLAFCRKAGYRPELAWTCHDYAEALFDSSEPKEQELARSLLDEALSISQELGMRPLLERVLALQERVQAQPEVAPAYPDGLTQREVEVLRLVAAGRTDREIGEELFISNRTVTTHVSNILNKANAANRAEAATYASRHGLV
ncbi:MAG: LuxR C-terminal-related transcriptional regulator, partial [Dehalococcoidia bacterium]